MRLNPVSQPMKTPTKNHDFCIIFIFDSTVSQKMDHFDISFACSIFSKSWEVTNYGFLGAVHLPVTLRSAIDNEDLEVLLDAVVLLQGFLTYLKAIEMLKAS